MLLHSEILPAIGLMGLYARKPDFIACKQQRPRPACALAQSDQCWNLESTIAQLAERKKSIFWRVFVAEQAGLGLTWSETEKTGFLMSRCNFSLVLKKLLKVTV